MQPSITKYGLNGLVSDRLLPHPLSEVSRTPRLSCPPHTRTVLFSRTDESLLSFPVKWQGHLHNIQLPSLREFSAIRELIFEKLCPDLPRELLRCDPLVRFYGPPPSDPKIFRLLAEQEEPCSWRALVHFRNLGGFAEVQLRCRGGADSAPAFVSSEQQPVGGLIYDDSLDWAAVDLALLNLSNGSPELNSNAPQPVLATAQDLHSLIPVGHLPSLSQWPPGYPALTPARLTALFAVLTRNLITPTQLPAWYNSAQWIDVRINSLRAESLGLPTRISGSSPNPASLVASLLTRLAHIIPPLRQLSLSLTHHTIWSTLESNVSIRFNPSTSKFLIVNMLLPPEDPQDPWRARLTVGLTRISEEAYVTFNPTSMYVEAELHQMDTEILVAIANTLSLSPLGFMRALEQAFSRAWQDTFVRCRYCCEKTGHGAQRLTIMDPQSRSCGIVVGLDLSALLAIRRSTPVTLLRLGVPNQQPVSLAVRTPAPPVSALWGLIEAARPALRPFPLDGVTNPELTTQSLLLGPFHRHWLSKTTRDKAAQLETLRLAQHDLDALAREVRFISRQGEAPFALLLSFDTIDLATVFAAHLAADPQCFGIFVRIFGEKPKTAFEALVPPECLSLLGDKGLRKALNQLPPDPGGQSHHAGH